MENIKENQNKKRLGRGIGSLLGGGEFSSSTNDEIQKERQLNELRSVRQALAQQNERAKTKANDSESESKVVAILDSAPENKRIWSIAIDKLVPGLYQPRKNFEKNKIEELAQSIKENGILQPITVRKRSGGGFEIIAGERRWRAAQLAGLHEVPAILNQLSDKEALQAAIIENVQREDLDPVEEAEGYVRLIKEFGYSQQDVASRVGKDRATVANSIRLISLTQTIKDMISQGNISTGHAKVLLSVADQGLQNKLALAVVQKGLSVRALEGLVKNEKAIHESNVGQTSGVSTGTPLNTHNAAGLSAIDPKKDLRESLAQELANQIQKKIGTKTTIQYKDGKGQMTIHFYSDDQLNQLFEALNK